MRTIDDYIDRAKGTAGLHSDRELCKALGLAWPTVNAWRMKRQWPKENHMIRLADLAGVDRLEALADLGAWRTDGQARACYQELSRKLARVISSALILLISQNAIAHERPGNGVTSKVSETIPYATTGRRRRRSRFSLIPLPA